MRDMTSIRLERDGNLFSQARQKFTFATFLFAAVVVVGALWWWWELWAALEFACNKLWCISHCLLAGLFWYWKLLTPTSPPFDSNCLSLTACCCSFTWFALVLLAIVIAHCKFPFASCCCPLLLFCLLACAFCWLFAPDLTSDRLKGNFWMGFRMRKWD